MTDHDIRDPQAEAARLRAIHTPPSCDYCSYNKPVDGFHILPDPEGLEGTWKVKCSKETNA